MCYGDNAIDLIWRMAVETNSAGEVLRIVLIGAHTDRGIDVHFPIPRDDKLAVFAPQATPIKRGVVLPPPSVTVLTPKRANDTDSNDESGPQV